MLLFHSVQAGAQDIPSGNEIRSVYRDDDINRLIREARSLLVSDPDTARVMLTEALQQSRVIGYDSGIVLSYSGLSNISFDRSAYEEALYYGKQALLHAGNTRSGLPYLNNFVGVTYAVMGRFAEAVPYLFRSLALQDETGDYYSAASAYLNIAGVLIHMPYAPDEHTERLISFFLDRVLLFARNHNNAGMTAKAMNNRASLLLRKKDFVRAMHHADSAAYVADSAGLTNISQAVMVTRGEIFLEKNEPAVALRFFRVAQSMQRFPDQYSEYMNRILMARAFVKLKQFAEAESMLQKTAVQATERHMRQHLMEVYAVLSDMYRETGRFDKALHYSDLERALKERVAGTETERQLNLMAFRYRSSEKDRALLEQQLELQGRQKRIERQQLVTVLIGSAGVFTVLLIWVLYRSAHRKHRLQEEQIMNMERQKELEQLKAIMNAEENERARMGRELHDGIGGMLTSIKLSLGKVKEGEPDPVKKGRISQVTDQLEDMMNEVRRTAHNLMPEVLSRYSLTEALVIFCDGISVNGPDIQVQVYGDWQEIPKKNELILYRIIQELIQNVVKHARAGQIILQLLRQEHKISIMVEDDGIGFDTSERIGGIGLQNLRYRIQALHGTLSIMSEPERGTIVNVEFRNGLQEV